MKRIFIILNLVFLLFISACNVEDIITDEVIQDIISSAENSEKIFLNVFEKDKLFVPLKLKNHDITWEYDENFISIDGNQITTIKDGVTFLKATVNNESHLFAITTKNKTITKTVQYNLNFYYSFIKDSKKIGKNIIPNKIIFHNTANTASAKNEIKWLNSRDNKSSTSFHFAVDDIGIYQAIPTNKASHHSGNYDLNNQSIGIEIAKSRLDDTNIKDSCIKNATILISLLMNFYNININDVITHYDASGKHCPHDVFDRYGLEKFYNEISELI